jgi:dTDP-4-dehydrorhamnose reductase
LTSTDYVFDGTKDSPYNENDLANPLNTYGRTELEGEEAIRAAGIPHLILRISWVYATRGRNFLLTILRLATQREELGIVPDQVGAPTWSRAIAMATSRILAEAIERSDIGFSEVSGTYHLTAAGATTWHAFASTILKQVSRTPDIPWLALALNGAPITVRRIVALTTAEYPTPARRPANSQLSTSRLKQIFHIELPDWRVQLQQAFAERVTSTDPCLERLDSLPRS